MARTRYRFASEDHPHFLTCTVVEWLPIFTRPETVQVVFDSWSYLQKHAELRIYGFVVLENHLHAVAQAPNLPDVWKRFKSYSARKLIDLLEEKGQDGCWIAWGSRSRRDAAIARISSGKRDPIPNASRGMSCCGRSWSTSTTIR
jgi:REP element-mobilizing transposase RayT